MIATIEHGWDEGKVKIILDKRDLEELSKRPQDFLARITDLLKPFTKAETTGKEVQ